MAVEWFCQLMGSELGPFTPSQLVEMARKHQITPEDMIKRGRGGEWVPAYRVKGLFEAAAKPPSAKPVEDANKKNSKPTMASAAASAATQERIDPAVYTPVKRMWFYISAGTKYGPMPFETLRERAESGQIKASDRVWSNTSPKWSEAKDVDGLDLM